MDCVLIFLLDFVLVVLLLSSGSFLRLLLTDVVLVELRWLLATADDEDGVLVMAAEVAGEFSSTPSVLLSFAVEDDDKVVPPAREDVLVVGSNDWGIGSNLLVGDAFSPSKSDGGLERSGDELLVAKVAGEIIVENPDTLLVDV